MSAKSDKTAQRLREQCEVLRFRPIPLNHMIPVMQEAADALDVSAQEVKRLREALCALVEHCEFVPMDSYYAEDTQAVLSNARAALQGDK